MPLLESKKNALLTEETAQVFDGMKGIQTARERSLKIMKKGDLMWILGVSKTPYDRLTGYFKDFHKRRVEKGIKCNYLYNEYASEFGEASKKFRFSEVRYMPKEMITHAWIEIYADTVTIGINYGKSFSIVITNQEVANSFKSYAEILWHASKPA